MQDESGILRIRECFAGLWSLEGEGSERILEEAVAKPEGFVLKPQREGGGVLFCPHLSVSSSTLSLGCPRT